MRQEKFGVMWTGNVDLFYNFNSMKNTMVPVRTHNCKKWTRIYQTWQLTIIFKQKQAKSLFSTHHSTP